MILQNIATTPVGVPIMPRDASTPGRIAGLSVTTGFALSVDIFLQIAQII